MATMQKVKAEIWPGGFCTADQSESFSALRDCTNFGKMSKETSLLTALSFCFGTTLAAVQQKHFKEIEKIVQVNCP